MHADHHSYNLFYAVWEDKRGRGPVLSERSISWCNAAALEEVNGVVRSIGNARWVAITVIYLFVSCITVAIAR
jgi:hypothetical protein